ncbi:MAG: hypothetical protein K2J28_09680 [Duncaniella sp.]|nr:hypothetical protein [Duncaniella sp.]
MEKVQECPHCKNYVVGHPNYTTEQKMVRHVTKKGINWGLKTSIVIIITVLGGIFGLGIGSIPGFILGLVVACFFGNSTEEGVNEITQNIYESLEYSFSCPKCGHIWNLTLKNGLDTDSDELLQACKDRKVKALKDGASGNKFVTILTLLMCICGIWYWNTHSFKDSLWVSILLLFAGTSIIVTGIGCLSCFSSWMSESSKASEIEKLTLDEFRTSKYRFEK